MNRLISRPNTFSFPTNPEQRRRRGALGITFPSVLPRMGYDSRIPLSDRREVTLTFEDACVLCAGYLKDMYNGVRYDRLLRESWNTSSPNAFCRQNIEAANFMGARLSYARAELMLAQPIPGLDMIPTNADLFETEKFDGIAGDVIKNLDDFTGVDVAVASKLLYQKRPGFFPVFDTLARRALGIAWSSGEAPADYLLLFTWHRRFLKHARNSDAVTLLTEWLNTQTDLGRELRFSRVRALDMLAWSLINYQDPFR